MRITFIIGDDCSGTSTVAEALARLLAPIGEDEHYINIYDDKYENGIEYGLGRGITALPLSKAPQTVEELKEDVEYIIVDEPNPVFFKGPHHIVSHRIIDVRLAPIEPNAVERELQCNHHEFLRRAIEISSSALHKLDGNTATEGINTDLKELCKTAVSKLKVAINKL